MKAPIRALQWLVRRAVDLVLTDETLGPRNPPPPTDTLAAARLQVQRDLETGCECPCCGQYAKLYRRPLYDKMARWLAWAVKATEGTGDWVYVGDGPSFQLRKGGGDFAKLQHWGLIEGMPQEHGGGTVAGWWRSTARGVAFVEGRLRVPSHVYLFDNKVQPRFGVDGFSDEMVSFADALGARFSLAEVLGVAPEEAEKMLRRRDSRQMGLFGPRPSGGEE